MKLEIENTVWHAGNNAKPLLGQLLIENQLITQEQLKEALKKQEETGQLLGATLLELDIINEEAELLPILAGQFGVHYIKLKGLTISPEILRLIPAQFITHYKVIPTKLEDGVMTIATSCPLNIHLLDEINLSVIYPLKPVLAGERDIAEAIRTYYGVGAETIIKNS